jgi:DNA-binding transcriptional ArsR family regulator
MKDGPDISQIGALIGDPARANMLAALMDGRALTAAELAEIGGITAQTASSHLQKLESGGLLTQQKQGRHKYFSLAGPKVAGMLEALMDLAADRGHLRHRPGPKDEALRKARICYDHLAGSLGVEMFDSLVAAGRLANRNDRLELTTAGERFLSDTGIDISSLKSTRRPLCRCCLDWSERRDHLAGSLGAALFNHIVDAGWAKRDKQSRAVHFTPKGETAFRALFAT